MARYAKAIHRQTIKLPTYLFSVLNCQTAFKTKQTDRAQASKRNPPIMPLSYLKPTKNTCPQLAPANRRQSTSKRPSN